MQIQMQAIGYFYTRAKEIPRHWSLSEEKGSIVVQKEFEQGLRDIQVGEDIVVIFYFHRSPQFSSSQLIQTPPHKDRSFGVFSVCSPKRPNPIGLSVLEVLAVKDNVVYVNRVDMLDQTPVLDIKPHIELEGK